jgi:predicted nucleic acid-binding Zn ribbon protein
VSFKGTGFYRTDSRDSGTKGAKPSTPKSSD